jgi:hypothetical protein
MATTVGTTTVNTIFKGMPVDAVVDLKDGTIKIYQSGQSGQPFAQVLASNNPKDGIKYTINNPTYFRNVYNISQGKQNKPKITTNKEFEKVFTTEGVPQLNGVRSAVINDDDSYKQAGLTKWAQIDYYQNAIFKNNTPGVTDPNTGITVNSNGTVPSTQNTGQQIPSGGGGGGGNGAGGGNGDGDDDNQPTLSEAENRLTEDARRGGPKGGTRYSAAKILRYPLGEPGGPFQYDYISITAHDYEPSGLGSNYEADKNLGIAYEKVILPMQPQLSETNAVNWSDDQLNPVQAMMGNFAAQAIGALADLSVDDIKAAFSNLGSDIKGAIGDPNNKAAIAAYFAGQAVGANVLGRSTGTVINPNLELLFNGPNLRTFNFNFRLTPREPAESEEIREIIFAFKRNMSVQRSKANLFLRSPRLFKLEYIYKGEDEGVQHPYLNKFKPCAMTNFQVNYTPDGSYATYDQTGSLTAYDLTMSFSEVMPIYASDNEYTDNPQDMGF